MLRSFASLVARGNATLRRLIWAGKHELNLTHRILFAERVDHIETMEANFLTAPV